MGTTSSSHSAEHPALLAWRAGVHSCEPVHGCVDYHRAWGLVRWLLRDDALPYGSDRLAALIEEHAAKNSIRILVCGGADSAITTFVRQRLDAHGGKHEVVFVDRCATACRVIEASRREASTALTVIHADILELDAGKFDIEIAHNFLAFFALDSRAAVVSRWAAAAADSCSLFLVQSLVDHESLWRTPKDEAAIRRSLARLGALAGSAGLPESVKSELPQVAERFWRSSPGRPPGLTEDALRNLLQRNGFSPDLLLYDPALSRGPLSEVLARTPSRRRALLIASRQQDKEERV